MKVRCYSTVETTNEIDRVVSALLDAKEKLPPNAQIAYMDMLDDIYSDGSETPMKRSVSIKFIWEEEL